MEPRGVGALLVLMDEKADVPDPPSAAERVVAVKLPRVAMVRLAMDALAAAMEEELAGLEMLREEPLPESPSFE